MNKEQLNKLWALRRRLDNIIWVHKYDLEKADELDDALRDLLVKLTDVLTEIAHDEQGASA